MINIIRKINFHISSKSRLKSEQPNNFSVKIPSGLITCSEDEYIIMDITQIMMVNSFYNTQESNNKFNISRNGIITFYEIPVGNYDVYQLLNILNEFFTDLIEVKYNPNLNKYSYKLLVDENVILNIYIAGTFLGFDNNSSISLIYNQEILCENYINVNGYDKLLFLCPSVNYDNNILDNYNGNVDKSNIIASIPVDVAPFDILIFTDYADTEYSYRLLDKEIKEIRLTVNNDKLELIDVGDYTIEICFIICTRDNINEKLNNIIDYLRDMFIMSGNLLRL